MAPKNKNAKLAGRETKESLAESDKPKKGSFRERALKAAKEAGIDVEKVKPEEKQPLLPGMPEQPPAPTILNGMMLFNFKSHAYKRDEYKNRVIVFTFIAPVTPEHQPFLPKQVNRCLMFLNSKMAGCVSDIYMTDQTLDVSLAPDDEEGKLPHIHLSCVPVISAEVKIVEEKGASGSKNTITRFTFKVQVAQDDEKYRSFADKHYDEKVWISLEDTQGTLE